ncbi:MAG: RagB/SusD family nutrient uptake outer membrane protein [Bacteroidota bacterium]|nr:RagB/SusD family nutrient uptake outer membrane protein [Bacteroidota bacterium]
MKKSLIRFSFFVLMMLLSCDKDYLEEPKPTGTVNSDVVFQSKESAEALISGILRLSRISYEKTDSAGLYSIFFARVVKGNDLILGNGWYLFDYENDNREPTYRRTTFTWEFPFTLINQINIFIDGVKSSTYLLDSEKQPLLGQAYAMRAFYYFQLAMEFQHTYSFDPSLPAPPIYKEPANEGKPMSSLSELYNFILEDLNYAVQFTPEARINKSYVNRSVAYAISAQVNQVMGNWQEAANMASAAKQSYQLNATQYNEGFDDMNDSEWIWAMPQQLDQSNYFDIAPHSFTDVNSDGYGLAFWNRDFVALFSDTDVRNTFTNQFEGEEENRYNTWTSSKFKFAFTSDIPIIRSAEMLLIEAEAKARLGDETEAADLLFELQKNRDINATPSGNSGESLIEEILVERRKELYGENGIEWYDAKRLRVGISRTGNHRIKSAANLQPDDKKFYLKIPQKEIDANNLIDSSVNNNR